MKVLAKVFCVVTMISVVAGCASKNEAYIPKVPPGVQAQLLDYFELPDNKVFILAVDPSGEYAYGFESGKATLKEAAKAAVETCDASRDALGVVGRPYIYALNNKVVYGDMIRAAHGESAKEEREAQAEEANEMMDEGDVEEASPAEVAEETSDSE